MRTTLTLEPDVALKLKRRMAAKKLTLKAAVNQALRAGLAVEDAQARVPFRVVPHSSALSPASIWINWVSWRINWKPKSSHENSGDDPSRREHPG